MSGTKQRTVMQETLQAERKKAKEMNKERKWEVKDKTDGKEDYVSLPCNS